MISIVDKYIKELTKIGDLNIFVDINGNTCVTFVKYDIEDTPGVIMTVTGRGISLESALCDFVNQISGKTLVSHGSSEKVKVLVINYINMLEKREDN